jgi:hypothetical protein
MSEVQVIESKQFSLSFRDVARGLVMAVLTPVIVIIQNSIASGELTFDWKNIGIAAIAGALAYLSKNFFEPSKVITIPEQAKIEQTTQTIKDAV